jgi:hypothetical protein
VISISGGGPSIGRLARGLIAYGIVGLLMTAIAAVAVGIALGRMGALGASLGDGGTEIATTLNRTATVLDDAASTAAGFGTTIDSSAAALSKAGDDIDQIVPRLRDIESRSNAINILGSQPLAPVAGLFGEIAGQLGDLNGQLRGVATDLTENRSALTGNAASLTALAVQTRALSARLGTDALARAVDDARLLLVAILVLVLAGVASPAVGALALGWWLRGSLRSGRPDPA